MGAGRCIEIAERSITDPTATYATFTDPRRDEWATKILPRPKAMPLRELMERTGLPRSTLQAIRAGRKPHVPRAKLLTTVASGTSATRRRVARATEPRESGFPRSRLGWYDGIKPLKLLFARNPLLHFTWYEAPADSVSAAFSAAHFSEVSEHECSR
jgi:hypothetical protein